MRLNISDIPEGGVEQELDLPVVIDEAAGPETAHVRVTVSRFGKKVLVEGTLKISVGLKCSRCLKEVVCPLDVAFTDELNPAEEGGDEEEQELTEKELDLSLYSNDEVDILELIKEQVLLALPMKPLCRPDCLGICVKCGQDLNESPCSCKMEETDPRLASLSKFKELIKDRGTS